MDLAQWFQETRVMTCKAGHGTERGPRRGLTEHLKKGHNLEKQQDADEAF